MQYQGQTVEVLGAREVLGERIAWVRILDTGEFLQVAESELEESAESFGWPHIRFAAIACKIREEIARKNILAPYESSLIPLPHQILVLEKVMQSDQARFLLADEVGMGKTIEAGLIMKELKLRGEANRILVIVPKSAMLQWQSELKEHFNEAFHIYDSQLINALAKTFGSFNADRTFNFWEQHDQIIVSTDALKPVQYRAGWPRERIDEYNRYRMEAVLEANFDLVIIDEVHKMGGSTPLVSRYVLAQALCNIVPNALLLSATPHRGKSDHFRRILQLLDPDAFAGEGLPGIEELQPYVIRTEKRLAVDYEGNKLFNERATHKLEIPLDASRHQRQLKLYEEVTHYVKTSFNAAMRQGNTATGLIMILFQRLVSSSTAAILSAMRGRLKRLRDGEQEDAAATIQEESDTFENIEELEFELGNLPNSATTQLDELATLEQLIRQAESTLAHELDAKLEYFLEKLAQLKKAAQNPSLKVLLFTEFRATQSMLREKLEERGYRCAIINGGQSLEERKAALQRFKEDSQILVATDAAGESLNMQFCHIVFNYDLPWNPMMIEQRIGRVDRIGQQNKVVAYNMLLDNSVDQRVYEVIEVKLNAILQQLGIDKTSDVLDSTLDLKEVNNLYLQSLLDPAHFEGVGEKWLYAIKEKLRDYQSTEGILPEVREEEIQYKKAAEVRYSPLPVWLEDMLIHYAAIRRGHFEKLLDGSIQLRTEGESWRAAFDAEVSLNNPGTEHFTLQHPFIKKALSQLPEFNPRNGIPVLKSTDGSGERGYWSLWKVEAFNPFESRVSYRPIFISDNGKQYRAYANEIWNHLVMHTSRFTLQGFSDVGAEDSEMSRRIESGLLEAFRELETEIHQVMGQKLENKERSYRYQVSRIEKIGIENIRISKLSRLEKSFLAWKHSFMNNRKVIPNIQHVMTIRIDG